MIDWRRIKDLPTRLRSTARALVHVDGDDYLMPFDGGWVNYADATHTVGSPQEIAGAATGQYTVDGSGAGTNTEFAGRMGAAVWQNSTLSPAMFGDCYTLRLTCSVSQDAVGTGHYIDFILRIGTGYAQNASQYRWPLIKGQGVTDLVSIVLPIFTLGTFGLSGGRLYIAPSHDVSIWGKALFIQRTFAG